ncbi:MAG: hypothetical protein CMP67_01895 [Flavobacteriales bacterium]|nr:hypothetical protein [Flavobacteriales bacterium]|tara:strand:- start:13063 stop:15015 length:1953 start_codon:yes stop_codon:yes gene_type:complete
MVKKVKYCLTILLFVCTLVNGQNRFEILASKLDDASVSQQGLNNTVDISVNNYTIQEIIRAIASENNLNVSIEAKLNVRPSYNFSGAKVKEVFLLLCKEHNLTLEWTGQIISFKTFVPQKKAALNIPPKPINLVYNTADSTVSGNLFNDTLYNVVAKLSKLSKINIDVVPSLRNQKVSMVIVNQKFTDVLNRLSGENEVLKKQDNFYQIKKKEKEIDYSQNGSSFKNNNGYKNKKKKKNYNKGKQFNNSNEFSVELSMDSLISVDATESDLKELIMAVCAESGKNYFLFDEPKGSISLKTNNLSFEETLSYLLNTSDFTYKKIDSVYIIGDRKKEKFRHTETYQFQYRTIEGIPDFIPSDLKEGVDIQESVELNALILSGALPQINELKRFFNALDKVVPMVLIEVMIVNIDRRKTISTGIGLGYDNTVTTNSVGVNSNPDQNNGVGVVLNAATLNRIVESITNLGFFNLGDVGNGFYLSMSALETNGNVKIVSTPKLAALNGHEAEMSIGTTEYYRENSTNYVGSQITQTVNTVVYKPLNADLSVSIKPVVSGDDQITLEISVSQSSFTDRIEEGAPPGSVKQEFKSIIRMKNKDMVVLGGLEKKTNGSTNSGVPVLNRIPVLKWFFGKQSKENKKNELTIFIRPTVIQ